MPNHDITEETECKHFRISLSENRWGETTRRYSIVNKKSRSEIGVIGWYAPWRQYCFDPAPNTVWSSGCLADIQKFLNRLNEKKG